MTKLLVPQTLITSIPIANKPPRLGGVIQKISPDEFEDIFDSPFAEEIWLDDAISSQDLKKILPNTSRAIEFPFSEQIPSVMADPFANICIAKINEKVGYGAFATKAIKKGSLVCIYSGEIGSSFNKDLKGLEHGYVNTNLCFKQNKFRSVASFIQHLPLEPKLDINSLLRLKRTLGEKWSKEDLLQNFDLYCITFHSTIMRDQLATANLDKQYINYRGIPIVAFIANRDIEVGEQLGMSYGFRYWQAMQVYPELFDKSGSIMPKQYYQRTFGNLYFANATYTGNLSLLSEEIKEKEFIVLRTCSGDKQYLVKTVVNELSAANALPATVNTNVMLSLQWTGIPSIKPSNIETSRKIYRSKL